VNRRDKRKQKIEEIERRDGIKRWIEE